MFRIHLNDEGISLQVTEQMQMSISSQKCHLGWSCEGLLVWICCCNVLISSYLFEILVGNGDYMTIVTSMGVDRVFLYVVEKTVMRGRGANSAAFWWQKYCSMGDDSS